MSATPLADNAKYQPAEHPLPSPAYARYAVGLLMLVYVLSFLDRQVMSILAEPIKRDLDLADWQIGAMTGLAFALLYTILGIPIARFAEYGHRPRIIAAAITVWSAFTLMCAFARSFSFLLLARVGVGIGEAGCTPPALSLISDYVPRERRSSAISVYLAGAPAGALLGMAIGGVVADEWGWRAAFLIAGAPGLLLSLICLLTLTEPRRRTALALPKRAPKGETLGTVLRVLFGKRTYRLVVSAATLKAFIQYSIQTFLASFYFRIHAVELAELADAWGLQSTGLLGIALGLILGLSGILGSIIGGRLADYFGARDIRAHMLIPALGVILGTPIYMAALFVDSLPLSLLLLIVPGILNAMYYGPAYAVVQGLAPPTMRSTATAVLLFIVNLIGLGLGPLFIGIVSDSLSAAGLGEAEGIRWALAIAVLMGIPAAALFFAARTSLQDDLVG